MDNYCFKNNKDSGQLNGLDLLKRVGDKEYIKIATIYDYSEFKRYIDMIEERGASIKKDLVKLGCKYCKHCGSEVVPNNYQSGYFCHNCKNISFEDVISAVDYKKVLFHEDKRTK